MHQELGGSDRSGYRTRGGRLEGRARTKPVAGRKRLSTTRGAPLSEKLRVTPEAERIYLKPDGSTYEAGEKIRNPGYARTLERLSKHGAEDFYSGDLAVEITSDLAANGSFVTSEDYAEYEIREEPPVVIHYRDYVVQTTQPPHGGPTLASILNILEGYDLARLGHNSPAYIHLVSMAMKAAFADRNSNLADPRFVDCTA